MPPEDVGLEAEVTQEQTPATERPEWLPEKFQTPEALAESYKHLESRLGQQGNDLASEREAREALEAQIEELTSQRTPAQPQVPFNENPLVAYAQEKLLEGDIGPFLSLTAEIGRQAATEAIGQRPEPQTPETDLDAIAFTAEQQVWQEHGDAYGNLRGEVAAILQDNPDLVRGTTFKDFKEGLDMAFRLAQRDELLQNQQKLAQQAAEQEASRQAKLQAQTATGAGTRPPTPDEQKQVWDEIKAATDGRWKGASAA